MTKVLHGKVHGRTIELSENLDLAEGQDVEVVVRILPPSRTWGEGILRSAGALADDPQWDAIMDAIHRERKRERRTVPEVE